MFTVNTRSSECEGQTEKRDDKTTESTAGAKFCVVAEVKSGLRTYGGVQETRDGGGDDGGVEARHEEDVPLRRESAPVAHFVLRRSRLVHVHHLRRVNKRCIYKYCCRCTGTQE
jgi:hypothetical protein